MPLPSSLTRLSVPGPIAPVSQQVTDLTSQTHDRTDSTKQPVIEIFQPTIDNSPSSTSQASIEEALQVEQQYEHLLRRMNSGSSSSSIGISENNNASTQWTTPKASKLGRFELDPVSVGAEGAGTKTSHLNLENINNNSVMQHRTATTDDQSEEKTAHLNTPSDYADIVTGNTLTPQMIPGMERRADLQRMPALSIEEVTGSKDGNKHGLGSVKWKDVLYETHEEEVPITEQSQMSSVLSEHPVSQLSVDVPDQSGQESIKFQHTQSSSQVNIKDSGSVAQKRQPYGSIHIASVPNVGSIDETTLRQHAVGDNTDVLKLDHEEDRLLPKPTVSPSRTRINSELSDHTLDPTYMSFLQFPTSSQMEDPDNASTNIAHGQEALLSYQHSYGPPMYPATESSHMNQYGFDMQSADQGLDSHHIDLNTTPHDPCKDSLSSIEVARHTAPDAPRHLMPMFSDVSISQKSMSFSSEQDQDLGNQGQRLIEMTSMSDRYSLPWPYANERFGVQTSFGNDQQGPEMFQGWQDQLGDHQTSGESIENQFHPLHEITSSTQHGDQVSIVLILSLITFKILCICQGQ